MSEDYTIDLGKIFMTKAVYDVSMKNERFAAFCWRSLMRFMEKDWGNTSPNDKKLNNDALLNGGRLLCVYEHPDFKTIWIIREANMAKTTILFPEDY